MKVEQVYQYYTGETGDFIRVIEENCIGCGQCQLYCTMNVWVEDNGKFFPKNLKNCVECGACWNVCTADAVIFDEPHGGTGVKFSYG